MVYNIKIREHAAILMGNWNTGRIGEDHSYQGVRLKNPSSTLSLMPSHTL